MESKEVAKELRNLADKLDAPQPMWELIPYEAREIGVEWALKFTYPSGKYAGQSYHNVQFGKVFQHNNLREIVQHLNNTRFIPSAVRL